MEKMQVFLMQQQRSDGAESEQEEEEPENIFEPPSAQQVFGAIKTLSTYLECNDFQCNVKQNFDFVQRTIENSILAKSVTQKKITDYFK